MKNKVLMFALMMSTIMLINCSPSSEKKVAETADEIESDIKDQKEETAKDLRGLRDDINAKLDKISKKLEDANSTSKIELESVKQTLIEHRDRVEVSLDQIDHSADDSWDDIQQSAKNTFSEVKLECEKIQERFDNAVKNTEK